ncbi:hypothetical protein FSP39_013373 [Pinctada imbricata]|uniref:Uncharacterized protein n=1 Tax=Pinctada imbricata TaxID=66713 RepID=A0AA88Y724_PINIB|nr:hypothetical protein FSP39_013373 [Pinctada imbricata]
MAEKQALLDLQRQDGNGMCADCGKEDPEWASCNIGVFLCTECAGVHRGFGTDVSRVKSIKLDNWDTDQVKNIADVGNNAARCIYEAHIPPYYRRPRQSDPDVLKAEWIKAKYSRKEFEGPDKQTSYNSTRKEGVLYKRGRDDKRFHKRKFVLCRETNRLSYYSREVSRRDEKPKEEMNLDDVNAVFVPDKVNHTNGMQITYFHKGSTRNLFVYSDDSKDIVDWYHAIRAAKLERRRIAFPDRDVIELAEELTRDFILEGWLSKMGPRNEPFKKRWFTLDKRKLMYLEEPLNAYPKGEIFLGHKEGGYSVTLGASETSKNCTDYVFTLNTPDRKFVMSAETREDMNQWICELQKIIELPLTPQDTKLGSMLVAKKSDSFRGYFSR